jgi:hypothetical protein
MAVEEPPRPWRFQESPTPRGRGRLTLLEVATASVVGPGEAFRSCIDTWDELNTVRGMKSAR